MSLIQEIRSLFESETGRGVLGQRVPRGATSLAALGWHGLYTVAGGQILLTCLYGICTVAETSGVAVTAQFGTDPTVGTAGVSPMSNAAGDIDGTVIGDIMAPQGDITLPCIAGIAPATKSGCLPTFSMPFICKPGAIGLTTGATLGGTWRFVLFFIPLDGGATVTAT